MTTDLVPSTIRSIAESYGLLLQTDDFPKPEFVGQDFKNTLYENYSDLVYHADKSAVARGDLVQMMKSPAHFAARRQRKDEDSDNDVFRFGRALHMLFLETQRFSDTFRITPEFGDMRSPKNRAEKAKWFADLPPGSTPVTHEELTNILGIGRAIGRNSFARELFRGGMFETTAYYRDPVTGLKCRVRPDIINRELGALVDLKTTISADFKDFQRSVWNYRYDFQLAMYASGIEVATGQRPEHCSIIAVEKTPPYGCMVYSFDPSAIERGQRDYRQQLDRLAECLVKNDWPGYVGESLTMTLPKWAFYE